MIIHHKVNSTDQLRLVPVEDGVEVDVRWNSETKDVCVSHDLVYDYCIPFRQWIAEYKCSLLIINVKDSQLEEKIIQIMKPHHNIKWFFLDSQIPDIVRLSRLGYGNRFIPRLSQYERIVPEFYELVNKEYVWLDTFGEVDENILSMLPENSGYILVSPELHRKPENIKSMKEAAQVLTHYLVCTDFPNQWR